MPLLENAGDLIRANLELLRDGKKAPLVTLGSLTDEQLAQVNNFRLANDFSPIIARIVFIGRHIYKSRIMDDGYTIKDVIEQIESATQTSAVVRVTELRTSLENPNKRFDRYGNSVSDRAVLECTAHHPWPELFSVIPIGDAIKPKGPPRGRPFEGQ
jgi:hypothetical protein